MKNLPKQLSLASLLSLAALPVSHGAILAYEGFASDLTGSGQNYQQDLILQGVDKTRTGFTGDWVQTSGTLTEDYNVESVSGNLTYANYKAGEAGRASAYLTTGSSSSSGGLGRALTIDDGDVVDGIFLAILIDFNDAEGGFTLESDFGATNSLWINNTTLTFAPGGGSATGGFSTPFSDLGVSASGTNLFILEYTTDTTGGPNVNYYSRWNLYINPDLSGGSLNAGDIDATGYGIGLINNGSIAAPASVSVNNRYINAGENMFADEIYVTNDSADFIIPEPSTAALLAGLATLGVCLWRRRRRQ